MSKRDSTLRTQVAQCQADKLLLHAARNVGASTAQTWRRVLKVGAHNLERSLDGDVGSCASLLALSCLAQTTGLHGSPKLL